MEKQSNPPRLSYYLRPAGFLVAIIVLFLLYIHMSYMVVPNSDNSVPLREAYNVLHGNITLRHWWLSPDTFYFTDLPFYVLAVAVAGVQPSLMHVVPAFIYAVTVCLGIYLIVRELKSEAKWIVGGIALVLIGIPTTYSSGFLLLGPLHDGTILFDLLAVWLATGPARRHAVGSIVLLALASVSDPFTYVLGIIPVGIVALLRWMRDHDANEARRLGIIAGASLVAAVLISTLLRGSGYSIAPASPPFAFATGGQLAHNFGLFVPVILGLFGGSFLGQAVGVSVVPVLIRLILFIIIMVFFIIRLRTLVGRRASSDTLGDVLVIAAVLDVAAFLFSDLPVDMGAGRYLTPFLVLGTIAALRSVPGIPKLRGWVAGVWALAPVWLALAAATAPIQSSVAGAAPLVGWLESHRLNHGYGAYWDAGIVSADSHGRVRVAPVVDYGPGIVPYLWLTNTRDYHESGPFFLVFQASAPWGGLATASATQTWGPPSESHSVGPYTVLVWSKSPRFAGPGYAP